MKNLATVPSHLSTDILRFCHAINPESTPVYIDSFPSVGNAIGNCFNNVHNTMNSMESSVFGWIIWQTSSYLLQAEFHNVIQSEDGTLMCVTPYTRPYKKILFLSDPSVQYENKRVPTIYKAINDAPETVTFIQALEALNEMEVYMSDPATRDYFQRPENNEKRSALQSTMNDIEAAIKSFESVVLKNVTRNSECICGSGKKFKKCCGVN